MNDQNENIQCAVCSDTGANNYIGVNSCYSCYLFFHQYSFTTRYIRSVCRSNCEIDGRGGDRSFCNTCRYEKCMAAGMKIENCAHYKNKLEKKYEEFIKKKEKYGLSEDSYSYFF